MGNCAGHGCDGRAPWAYWPGPWVLVADVGLGVNVKLSGCGMWRLFGYSVGRSGGTSWLGGGVRGRGWRRGCCRVWS